MREFEKLESGRYQAIQQRLNVIDITGPNLDPRLPLVGFAPAFTALQKSEAITCLSTNKTVTGLHAPTLAIIDPFAAYAIEAIRAISKDIPILSWWTAPVGGLIRLMGPASMGGMADPSLEFKEGRAAMKANIPKMIAQATQTKFEPNYTGKVANNIPGLAGMYDYEWFPQRTILSPVSPIIETIGAIYIRETDGLLSVSSSAYEPEAVAAASKWFDSIGKTFHTVGPLDVRETRKRVKSDTDKQVMEFLDRVQQDFGEKSLLYISFGTHLFPLNPEKVWAVFEELIDSKTPFFFAHPSMYSVIPNEIKTKIADSGCGMDVTWAPQELILSHPATGWFITHGGWNSLQEAFLYRVPLIFWPYQADQPYNATFMSQNLKAAFELVTVRTDECERIPYRYKDAANPPSFTLDGIKAELRTILKQARGDEGALIRKNFGVIADRMGNAWTEKGESKAEFDVMLQRYGLRTI